MVAVAENLDIYLGSFEKLRKDRAASEPEWLSARRCLGMQRFAELGFPTPRNEEWKYTNLAPLARKSPPLAQPVPDGISTAQLESAGLAEVEGHRLVFVNGRFDAALSRTEASSDGVQVGTLSEEISAGHGSLEEHFTCLADVDNHALVALNTAFLEDAALIEIPARAVLDKPIHIVFLTSADHADQVSHPRVFVRAGRDSQATLIESYLALGDQPYWSNPVTEIVAGENARVEHYKLQWESTQAWHTGIVYVRQHRDSNFVSHSLSFGGRLVRADYRVVLADQGCECTLNGLYTVKGSQHVDHHTTIDHAHPHCNSHQLYKGVLDDRSTAVFNGKIMVREDAQKTDAFQSNKNLLLSENAAINTKPQLEIFANDVRCSHGATVGQIDEEATFYLRSRGISHSAARGLLTYAFAADILERIQVETLRDRLESDLRRWLSSNVETKEDA